MTGKFTPFEISIMFYFIMCFAFSVISCTENKKETEVKIDLVKSLKVDSDATYATKKIELEGHSYFIIRRNSLFDVGCVHNPECPKCHTNK